MTQERKDDNDEYPPKDDPKDDDNSESIGNEEEEASICTKINTENNKTTIKLKCQNCHRLARNDCTGKLCIRCCQDTNCKVHQELKAKQQWKEDVMNGTTDIQLQAKQKRRKAIPKGRFKEKAFRYMNDTVVIWDLQTTLNPTLAISSQNSLPKQSLPSQLSSPATNHHHHPTTTSSSSTTSSTLLKQYQNDLKIKEEILRRSRKNNQTTAYSQNPHQQNYRRYKRNYRYTSKRFRSIVQDLYQKTTKTTTSS